MTTSENDSSAVVKTDNSADNDRTSPAPHKEHLHVAQNAMAPGKDLSDKRPAEYGGQAGLEPTRYGDWERKGRCTDF